MNKGKLYLIPNTLGSENVQMVIPSGILGIINNINHYIVENIPSAVSFLKQAGLKTPIKDLTFRVLNKNTEPNEIYTYLDELENGNNAGLISEAGLPCIADPGSIIVKLAHTRSITVIPLTGPSSIMLALMASGFNGQQFSFNGYLPIEKIARMKKLKELEKKVKFSGETQIFIEAPHRNDKLFEDIISICANEISLCIAKELTNENEMIAVNTVINWKKNKIVIGKVPAIFILGN